MANSDQQNLGESAGTGTRLTTASSFSGQASRSTFSYKVDAGPSSSKAKKPIVEPTGSPKVDEAKTKAANAIKLAREKGEKATAKAIKEAKAAQKEARDKTAFELAEKRKQEVLTKQEKQKEKKMKEDIERDKKAK